MKIFYDTELIEDGKTIDLISIGLIREDGIGLYMENAECDLSRASEGVKENVIPHLKASIGWVCPRRELAERVRAFVQTAAEASKVELWGYYSAYDHVALCQLFGPMVELPKGFPMYTRDLKQWCDLLGNPQLPKQSEIEHHALADAVWNKEVYTFLHRLSNDRALAVAN